MEYVYNKTLYHQCPEESMRKLVSQFAAIHYTDLMTGDFEEFFSRGGDFTLVCGAEDFEALSRQRRSYKDIGTRNGKSRGPDPKAETGS
jgi:alkyl hydroperoxide reductase subunit AhpC